MEITFENPGRCLWHTDCDKTACGVMKVVRHEEGRSLLECLDCGRRGYYPVGGVGRVCVEEVSGE